MKQNTFIPDHSPRALDEAYQAALLSLAFQQIEQEELNMIHKQIQAAPHEPQTLQFEKKLGRRLRGERTRSALAHSLPKLMRAVACIVTVLAIGTSVALALSQEARSWAAGVLTGTGMEGSGFFTVPAEASKVTDGVSYGERLLLLNANGTLELRESTDAEPVRYAWKDQGARKLVKLETLDGTLYALYEDGYASDDFVANKAGRTSAYHDGQGCFDALCLGQITLLPDGTFTVEQLSRLDGGALFGPDARTCYANRIAAGNGRLYFTVTSVTCQDECFSFGDDSLFCIDLSNYALTELPAPTGSTVDPRYRLFADGTAFVAVEDPARIYRIEPDGGYTLMAEFEPTQRPNSYAYNAETDTLYYQLESAVYAAPHFDIANACRAALSGGAGGRGLLIGKNSYVIVGTFDGKGEVFDLDEKPANVTELVVSGMGAFMSDAVRAQNPSLTLVEDPVRNALFNEDEGGEYAARYCEKLLSGEAKADLVRSFYDEDAILQRAGWGKPITDKALCAEIDLMPDGMRDYVTKDGAYIGMPNDTFSILSDITISTKNWAALGLGEYPTTWMELLEKLAALSHSADAGKYGISTPYLGIEQTLAAQLANGYARSWAAQGMEMDFGGTEFKAALDMLKPIDFAALRHDAEGSWSEASQPLLSLGGSECSPIFEFSFAERRTLKVHPEDSLISEAGCYIVRINPNTHAEQQAYALLRAQTSNDQYIYNRLTYDFATPAAELAGLSGGRATAEQIERFRRNVGDVWFSGLDARTAEKRDEALADYAQGEMDFDALAAQLGEIYAK